jgi:hypothetical protein
MSLASLDTAAVEIAERSRMECLRQIDIEDSKRLLPGLLCVPRR